LKQSPFFRNDLTERFHREAQNIQMLNEKSVPHVPKLVFEGKNQWNHSIIVVDGYREITLSNLILPLANEKVEFVMKQLREFVNALHLNVGKIYPDWSATNIVVNDDLEVLIIDFEQLVTIGIEFL